MEKIEVMRCAYGFIDDKDGDGYHVQLAHYPLVRIAKLLFCGYVLPERAKFISFNTAKLLLLQDKTQLQIMLIVI